MVDIKATQASNAYQSAMRVAEKVMDETSIGESKSAAPMGGASFQDMVGTALDSARDTGYQAEAISTKGLAGKVDMSEVVTAVANAETALNTVVTIRDRVINAYQDIIKMPI